jgi:hypothetical protein
MTIVEDLAGDGTVEVWCGKRVVPTATETVFVSIDAALIDFGRQHIPCAACAAVDMAMSGTFSTYLSHLRRNGLVTQSGGKIAASDSIFAGRQ